MGSLLGAGRAASKESANLWEQEWNVVITNRGTKDDFQYVRGYVSHKEVHF